MDDTADQNAFITEASRMRMLGKTIKQGCANCRHFSLDDLILCEHIPLKPDHHLIHIDNSCPHFLFGLSPWRRKYPKQDGSWVITCESS